MVNVRHSLVGQTFGRLKVLKQADDYVNPSGVHYAQYECECQCKNKTHVIVQAQKLKSGHTKSCGCLNIESHYKRNKYDLSNDYGIGYTNNREQFYFDLEDYEKIKDYTWYLDKDGYVVSDKEYMHYKMHRVIMNAKDGCDVDHIHGKNTRNDNRKHNLRICTRSENARNKTTTSRNTSGFIGVYWNSKIHRWQAKLRINGIDKYLGSFVNKQDAINARIAGEQKYFGEFAPIRE